MSGVLNLDHKKIIKQSQDGMSIVDLAKLNKVSVTPIRKILKDNNIPTRHPISWWSHLRQRYSINENYFENIDNPNKAYILGLLCADGNLHSKTALISLELIDRDIIKTINTEIGSNRPLLKRFHGRYNPSYRISISNIKMYGDLIKLGLTPNKTFTLEYPKNIPKQFNRHLIRGYFDGDGHINFRRRGINSKYSGTEFQILGTSMIINSIRDIFKDEVSEKLKIGIRKKVNMYELRILNKPDLFLIYDYLYKDSVLYIKRKKSIFDEISNERFNPNGIIYRRRVNQYTMDGKFIREWDCPNQVRKILGISDNTIYSACRGEFRTAGKYIWKFA